MLFKLSNPILLIGTTSSGKSTIANLLTGHYILPSGVQETTTRIVEIYHGNSYHTPLLSISNPNSSHSNLKTDRDIRTYLNQVMTSPTFNGTCVSLYLSMMLMQTSWINYFDYLVQRLTIKESPISAALNIASGFIVRDFPGFQSETDNYRLDLIKKYLDTKSIILFVFNAEETDSVKENKLLKFIFSSFHKKGYDWRSIIFVLNRKDAFYRDATPDKALLEALKARQQQITKIIKETGQQNLETSVNIIPFSAGLAFANEMLYWRINYLNDEDRKHLEHQLSSQALPLLSEKLTEELPLKIANWNNKQRLRVYQEIYQESGLVDFIKMIKHTQKLIVSNKINTA